MRNRWMEIAAMLALAAGVSVAQAQPATTLPVGGESCKEKACSGTDGRTGGGACTNNYCAGGSGGTGGGTCLGIKCQGGNGGTRGGSCIGDYCKAGDGGTGGGHCTGKGCQAGNGGTTGGSCTGEGCKPGNRGRVEKGETVQNMGCCIAWTNIPGLLTKPDKVAACNEMLSHSKNPAKCSYSVRNKDGTWKDVEVEPASETPPEKMPPVPTSVEDIKKQRGH